MAIFDFESICRQEDKFNDTDTTASTDMKVPMFVSLSSHLFEQPIFLCNSNPKALVESFVDALDGLAKRSKAQMELKFFQMETSVKSERNQVFSVLNHCRCRTESVLEIDDGCIEKEEEQNVSTHFLQTQQNQLIHLHDHLKRCCNVLTVFEFNGAK